MKVLVVDDDPSWRQRLSEWLKEMGHNVEVAAGLDDAEVLLESTQFGACLLDGDLGDGGYDENSLSGRLFGVLVEKGIKVIRATAEPSRIPDEFNPAGMVNKATVDFTSFERGMKVLLA